jgi:hypothetical protein
VAVAVSFTVAGVGAAPGLWTPARDDGAGAGVTELAPGSSSPGGARVGAAIVTTCGGGSGADSTDATDATDATADCACAAIELDPRTMRHPTIDTTIATATSVSAKTAARALVFCGGAVAPPTVRLCAESLFVSGVCAGQLKAGCGGGATKIGICAIVLGPTPSDGTVSPSGSLTARGGAYAFTGAYVFVGALRSIDGAPADASVALVAGGACSSVAPLTVGGDMPIIVVDCIGVPAAGGMLRTARSDGGA